MLSIFPPTHRRYAIDFPDDAYLRAVQRVAYVTVFAPGSQEHRELVHLLEQARGWWIIIVMC